MSARWNEHLRPRSPYEAIDFGFLFARAYYGRLFALAAVFAVPMAIGVSFVVPGGAVGASFVVWWAKPLWERAILSFLGKALFDEPPSVRDVASNWRTWTTPELLASLTWRRFSPTRSFDMPITLLEGGTGPERARRVSLLHRGRFGGAAIANTILLLHVEAFLQIAFLILLSFAIPDAVDFDFMSWLLGMEEESATGIGAGVVVLALYVVSVLLVAPFYVGAGFALYLHRRTELEAWDLEVAFRRLADRVRRRNRRLRLTTRSAIPSLLALGLFLCATPFDPAAAAAAPLDRDGAREAIDTVLEADAYHAIEVISIPKFLFDWELENDSEAREWPEWLTRLLDFLGQGVAGSIEVVAIALAVLALGWILLRFVPSPSLDALGEHLGGARPRRIPRELFGMVITEESLPEDLVALAAQRVAEGRVREALALLYRGALSRLVLDRGVDLPLGVTERECLSVATPLLAEGGARYFGSLTRTWLLCAYGHVEPDRVSMESLCSEWSTWFDRTDSDSNSNSIFNSISEGEDTA